MLSLLKSLAGSFFGGGGTSPANKAAGWLGGMAKGVGAGWIDKQINGIPQPKTGAAAGSQQLDYMNQAFPGTNAWERLGQSNAAAGVSAAKQSGRNQKSLQRAELITRERIADKQMRTQVAIASIPYKGGVYAPKGDITDDGAKYDTPIMQAREKIRDEIAKMKGEVKNLAQRTSTDFQEMLTKKAQLDGHKADTYAKEWASTYAEFHAKAGVSREVIQQVLHILSPIMMGQVIKRAGKIFAGKPGLPPAPGGGGTRAKSTPTPANKNKRPEDDGWGYKPGDAQRFKK